MTAHKKVHHKPSSVFAVKGAVPAEAGPISVPGVEVGDLIFGIFVEGGHWVSPGQDSGFEPVVSVADEIMHTGGGGPNDIYFVLVRMPNGH